jgi:hypothetical protein
VSTEANYTHCSPATAAHCSPLCPLPAAYSMLSAICYNVICDMCAQQLQLAAGLLAAAAAAAVAGGAAG